MLARYVSLCLLGCVSCLASAESAPDEATPSEPSNGAVEAGPPYDANAGYKDPCIHGEVVVLQGREVHVPIPCAVTSYDTSDPPPYERADPEQRVRPPEDEAIAVDPVAAPAIRIERNRR